MGTPVTRQTCSPHRAAESNTLWVAVGVRVQKRVRKRSCLISSTAAPPKGSSTIGDPSAGTMRWTMLSNDDVDVLTLQFRDDLAALRKRISGFADLEPDWDSYGADSPSAEAIRVAQHYLDDLVELYAWHFGDRVLPFWAAPLPSGGVQLEWRAPAAELEIEVDSNGRLAFLLQKGHGAGAEYQEGEDASLEEVASLLGQLLAS